MYSYAQTNIQLFNQMRHVGYSNTQIQDTFNAYKLTMSLFTGLFRSSGKTFIAHLVSTASILASLRVPTELVVAGLLHAAYTHGDFGDGRGGISDSKREHVRGVIGGEAEDYIARYTVFSWNEKTISTVCNSHEHLSSIEQNILLMRLANELEDHLDLDILYCRNVKQRQQYINSCGAYMLKIAENLGVSTLAAELTQVFRESTSTEIPRQLHHSSNSSFVVPPNSYHRRLSVIFRRKLAHSVRRLRSVPQVL